MRTSWTAIAPALLVSVGIAFLSAVATPSPEVEGDAGLPRTGNLSTSVSTGAVVSSVPDPFGGNDPSGKQVSPITGSVSRLNPDTWIMKVFNNSQNDTYSVTVDVIQRNDRGAVVRSDSFSHTLKPESSTSREVFSGVGARDAELNLRHWTNLTEKRPKKAEPVQGELSVDEDSGGKNATVGGSITR